MDSTRANLSKDLLGINQPTGREVSAGFSKRLMERGTVIRIEPIARIEWQELQFGALRQVRRLINDEASFANACFDGHATSVASAQRPREWSGAHVLCTKPATDAPREPSSPLVTHYGMTGGASVINPNWRRLHVGRPRCFLALAVVVTTELAVAVPVVSAQNARQLDVSVGYLTAGSLARGTLVG